ncbi:hypothetical protein CI610_00103 [invertebrate metagenome]|uniref:Autotransporter domain-containing protein n=1 Tax=invertebrate metagenome TaxID=1711999 RepID=A0A2H9TCG9_9ZZZZ
MKCRSVCTLCRVLLRCFIGGYFSFVWGGVDSPTFTHNAIRFNPESKVLTQTFSRQADIKVEYDTEHPYKLADGRLVLVSKQSVEGVSARSLTLTESDYDPLNRNGDVLDHSAGLAGISIPYMADRMNIYHAIEGYHSFARQVINASKVGLLHRHPDLSLSVSDNLSMTSASADVPEEGNWSHQYFAQALGYLVDCRLAVLMQLNYGYYSQNETRKTGGFRSHNYGFQSGFMGAVTEDIQLGLYVGWDKSDADIRHTKGTVETMRWALGPVIAWHQNGFRGVGILTYTWVIIDSFFQKQKMDYKSNQWSFMGYGAYDISLSDTVPGLMLTPELQILYSHQKRDAFDSGWLGVTKSAVSQGFVTRLGGSASYQHTEFNRPLALCFSAGWQNNGFKSGDLKTDTQKFDYKNSAENAVYYSWRLDIPLTSYCDAGMGYNGTWCSKAVSHFFYVMLAVHF